MALQYDPESTEAVKYFMREAGSRGYLSLATDYIELLDELEIQFLRELRKRLSRIGFPLDAIGIEDEMFEREMLLYSFYSFEPVTPPLNIAAMLLVLFNELVAPQRNFRQAEEVMTRLFQDKLSIQDGNEVAYNSSTAEAAESQENFYWRLFDTALELYPQLAREPSDDSSSFEPARFVSNASKAVCSSLIARIQGDRNA